MKATWSCPTLHFAEETHVGQEEGYRSPPPPPGPRRSRKDRSQRAAKAQDTAKKRPVHRYHDVAYLSTSPRLGSASKVPSPPVRTLLLSGLARGPSSPPRPGQSLGRRGEWRRGPPDSGVSRKEWLAICPPHPPCASVFTAPYPLGAGALGGGGSQVWGPALCLPRGLLAWQETQDAAVGVGDGKAAEGSAQEGRARAQQVCEEPGTGWAVGRQKDPDPGRGGGVGALPRRGCQHRAGRGLAGHFRMCSPSPYGAYADEPVCMQMSPSVCR